MFPLLVKKMKISPKLWILTLLKRYYLDTSLGLYTFSFFYVMLQINNNNLSIYVPIFLIVGMLIYNCTIQSIIQYTYEQFFKKINQKKLHIKAKFDIIKMERRKKKIEKYEKNQKSKKSYGYSEQT